MTLYLSPAAVIRENTEMYAGEKVVINISNEEIKSTKTTIPFVKDNNFDYSWFAAPLPLSWQHTAGWIIFIVFTILIVTGTSNGANLTDGLDGLAAGISTIIGVGLMIFSYTSSHIVFGVLFKYHVCPWSRRGLYFLCCFYRSMYGFLWYNGFPAKVFMGDTGSLMLGGVIAVIAIIIHK